MGPEIYLFIFSIIFVVILLAYIMRKVMPVSKFLYADARIMARSSNLIKDKDWQSMAESKSLPELTNHMKDSDFFESLEKVTDIKSFHTAAEKNFVSSIIELRNFSPKKVQPIIDAYLMFWEAKVMKTIYREKHEKDIKVDLEEEGLVFDVGNINPTVLKHLLETESLADMNVVMADTLYSGVFSKEYASIEEFEIALDNFIHGYFVGITKNTKMYDANTIIDIVNTKFDIMNLLALIKMEVRDVPEDKRLNLMINIDTELSKHFEELSKAKGIKDLVQLCEKLPYHQALSEALIEYEKDKSLTHFEKYLLAFFRKRITDMDISHNQGPFPIFSYLLKKEFELRNVLAISKGIDAKFNTDEIKELLI